MTEGNRNTAGWLRLGGWWGFLIRYVMPLVILVMIVGIYDTIIDFIQMQ